MSFIDSFARMCYQVTLIRDYDFLVFVSAEVGNVLTIAGSNQLRDWTTSLNFKPNIFGFHSGYWNRAMAIPEIKADYVTGYSLGGAVAAIYARRYKIPCITFNAPRFAYFEVDEPQILHLSINNDLVGMLPFGLEPNQSIKWADAKRCNPHDIENFFE